MQRRLHWQVLGGAVQVIDGHDRDPANDIYQGITEVLNKAAHSCAIIVHESEKDFEVTGYSWNRRYCFARLDDTARKSKAVIVLACTSVILGVPTALAKESACYGDTGSGRLENGVRLPLWGNNFESYSFAASLVGRSYVHSKVHHVIVTSYRALEELAPNKFYVYGETGWPSGGGFAPHKTHQNGLSVDFMVPVVDQGGDSVALPTHFFNKLGYEIEFDAQGAYGAYTIDFDAMASHIVAVNESAKKHQVGLRRVIFDPVLQPFLLETRHGEYLRNKVAFSEKPSWIRHDEHYHIDFIVPCQPL